MYKCLGGFKGYEKNGIKIPKILVLCKKEDMDILLDNYFGSVEKVQDENNLDGKCSINLSATTIHCRVISGISYCELHLAQSVTIDITKNIDGTPVVSIYNSVLPNTYNFGITKIIGNENIDVTYYGVCIEIEKEKVDSIYLNIQIYSSIAPFDAIQIRQDVSVFGEGDVYTINLLDKIDEMKLYNPIYMNEYEWVRINGSYLKDFDDELIGSNGGETGEI